MKLLFACILATVFVGNGFGQTVLKPTPKPTPDILKGGNISNATDRLLTETFGGDKGKYDGVFDGAPNSAAAGVPAEWKRTVLIGTGLSVASPMPFTLRRSEPLASIQQTIEADVLWEFTYGDLRAYVGYTKEDKGYKAVRQHLEDVVQYMLNNAKATEMLIHDTKFLGETGAFYDETHYESSSNRSIRRKILVYGRPNDYVKIDLIFPDQDAEAAALSSQIISSFKKEGSLAVGKSNFPPAEWKLYNFGGLLFEFPVKPAESSCTNSVLRGTSHTCGVWGENLVNLRITYSTEAPGKPQLTATQAAEQHVKLTREIDAEAKSSWRSEYRIAEFPLNFGEAVVLTATSGFSDEQIIFVRRGNALWEVRISYSTVLDPAEHAGKRVAKSIRFKD